MTAVHIQQQPNNNYFGDEDFFFIQAMGLEKCTRVKLERVFQSKIKGGFRNEK